MNLNLISKRVAVVGASVAVATAGLVATTSGAANADPVTNTNLYFCSQPVSATPIPVIVNWTAAAPTIPATVPAGYAIAAKSPTVGDANISFTVPTAALAGFQTYGIKTVKVSIDDWSLGFGDSAISYGKVKSGVGKIPKGTPVAPLTVAPAKALQNKAFNLPSPGAADITLPSSFSAVVTAAPLGDLPVTCALADAAVQSGYGLPDQNVLLGSTTAVKLPAKFTNVKAPASAKFGAPVVVKADLGVDTAYSPVGALPTGSVAVLEGSTPVGGAAIVKGKVKVTITGGALAKGSHTLHLGWAGDTNLYGAASDNFTVLVK